MKLLVNTRKWANFEIFNHNVRCIYGITARWLMSQFEEIWPACTLWLWYHCSLRNGPIPKNFCQIVLCDYVVTTIVYKWTNSEVFSNLNFVTMLSLLVNKWTNYEVFCQLVLCNYVTTARNSKYFSQHVLCNYVSTAC